MPEAEVPEEARNPFERRVAITIAIIAVLMAINENHNDNAKTDALLKTTEASNQWAFFQSKSIKEHSYDLQRQFLAVVEPGVIKADQRELLLAKYAKKIEGYEQEKSGIQAEARKLNHEADANLKVNNRCDLAGLLLQISVILCSVAILVHLAPFWYMGMVVALVGASIGATAFFMPEGGEAAATEHAPASPVVPASPAHAQ